MNSHQKTFNHAAWIGPLVALIGIFTYFSVAVRIPALRDSAIVNLVLVIVGVLIAAWGLVRRRNWKSWIGFGAAGFFAFAFCAYIFALTSHLPSPDSAPAVGAKVPPLDLPDQRGRIFSLDRLQRVLRLDNPRGGRVLVVFYRGFW